MQPSVPARFFVFAYLNDDQWRGEIEITFVGITMRL
jgi:hypothetical protein